MSLNKYFEFARVNFINTLIYFWDFIASGLFVGLIIFIFINLWKVIYVDTSNLILGYTINMMIWYLVVTESIVTSHGKLIEEIGEEIQSGNIAQNLNKPYNYILFKYFSTMSRSCFRFIVTFFISSIVTLIFIGGFQFNFMNILFVIISVLLAITLHFFIMICLGVLAFWIEDVKSVHFIYQKFVFVIGGMLVPLEVFPLWLAKISKALPFSYIAYHPAKLFVNFNLSYFLEIMSVQLIWIIIFICIITILYNVAIKKLSINGG